FYLPLELVNLSAFSLLAAQLTLAQVKYGDESGFSDRCQDLYDAQIHAHGDIYGDVYVFQIGISALRTAPDGSPAFYLFLQDCLDEFSHGFVEDSIHAEHFPRLLRRVSSDLKTRRYSPEWRLWYSALAELFPDCNFAADPQGDPEEMKRMSWSDVCAAFQLLWEQAQRGLFLSGDIQPCDSILLLDFLKSKRIAAPAMELQPCKHPALIEAERVGRRSQTYPGQQSHGLLVYSGTPIYFSHRIPKLELLLEYLAGEQESILFRRLREDRALVYDIEGFMDAYLRLLAFQFSGSEESLDEVFVEIRRAVDEIASGVIDSELLKRVRQQLLSRMSLCQDALESMVDFAFEENFSGRRFDPKSYAREITDCCEEELVAMAVDLRDCLEFRLLPEE
ncbi:MAG: insulinase family protein, partial [Eubacteriales bacterium]|nr:insulinase family protein [Eubacteriales bacterium]